MERFNKYILSQINNPTATADFGSVGSQYQYILCVENGKIKPIGQLLYRIHRESLGSIELLQRFGQECEKYRIGKRDAMPSCHFFQNGELDVA